MPSKALLDGVCRQIAHHVKEVMQTRFLRWVDVSVPRASLARCLRGGHNIHLATLIAVADALGCDVIIHLRVRPLPPTEGPPNGVH